MAVFPRRVQETKTELYILDLSNWLAEETVTALTVTDASGGLVSIGSTSIDGYYLTALITGVTAGVAKVHFEWTTQTRSKCYEAIVVVTDNCN